MKIAFDISAQAIRKSGVGYYQYHLLRAMVKRYPDFTFTLFGFNFRNYKKLSSEIRSQKLEAQKKIFKIPHRLILFLWIYLGLPTLNWLIGDHEVYQVSELAIPKVKNGKSFAFVHDLTTILFPDYHTRSNIFLHQKRFKKLNQVDAILTNSYATKNDIVEHLKINPNKVHVTYLAADEKFKKLSVDEVNSILKKYHLKKPYLLFVGTLEPRKNLKLLIKIFEDLKKQFNIPHQLVLVGQKGWKYESIINQMNGSEYKKEIHHLGYVDDGDLPALYNDAEVFVYPSLYEGFGLPILEAMQCGVPVMTSNTSSLPEVGGEACLYADPYQKNEWVRGLYRLIQDKDLCEHLSEKGLQHAQRFSWDKCAEETMKVYKGIA